MAQNLINIRGTRQTQTDAMRQEAVYITLPLPFSKEVVCANGMQSMPRIWSLESSGVQ